MNKDPASGSGWKGGKLRRDAELLLEQKPVAPAFEVDEDPRRLVHELQVHRIELEMQNEELQATQRECEAALERYTRLFDSAPIGYFVVSADGIIRQVNLAGARLMRTPMWALVDRRMGVFVEDHQRKAWADFLLHLATSSPGERQECELEVALQGDEPWEARMVGTLLETSPLSILLTVEDVTRRKRADAALLDELRRKNSLIARLQGISKHVDAARRQVAGYEPPPDGKDA